MGAAFGNWEMYNETYRENTASWSNGAVFFYGSGQHGGRFWQTMQDCSFYDNSGAVQGGAIMISGMKVIVDGGTFERNHADGGAGGAISSYLSNGGHLIVRNGAVFKESTAKQGAAIFGRGLQLEFDNIIFHNNVASEQGGGLWLESCQVVGDSVDFSSNLAAMGGAAFTSKSTVMKFYNSAFASNEAKDGSDLLFAEEDTAHNAVVFNNCTARSVKGGNRRRLGTEIAEQGYALGENAFLVFDKRSNFTATPNSSTNVATQSDCGITADVSWLQDPGCRL
jgi:hypothetical protein